jgi:hypothetical protein
MTTGARFVAQVVADVSAAKVMDIGSFRRFTELARPEGFTASAATNKTDKSSGLPHKTRDDPSYKIAREVRLARCGLHRQETSVAVAGIGALAGFGPAVGLAFLAGVLVIGVAVVLGPFAFAFMRIVGNVIARGGLAGMILGYGNREREQRSKEQHSHRGSS